MSTDSAENGIDFLFASENAAPSAEQANPQTSEQPTPPDVDPFTQPATEATPPQHAQQPVPGQEPPAAQPQQQPHMVPLAELEKTRERARAAEEYQRNQQREIDQLKQQMAQLAQPQQQQQQIDPELDPIGAYNALRNEFSQVVEAQRVDFSRSRAIEKFGEETVIAAAEAAGRAGLDSVFASRPDPFKAAMDWYQGERLREQIGADPTAYEKQIEERVRQQLLAQMRQGTPPPSNLPPSLSGATNANPASHSAVVGSDNDFFNEMMNRKRG